MKMFADYHTHTRYSHGEGTVRANVEVAKIRGLEVVAITDHGPASIGLGVRNLDVFKTIKEEIDALNAEQNDVKVLFGVEANIISTDGELDVPRRLLKEMDVVVASLHPLMLPATLQDGVKILGLHYGSKLDFLRGMAKRLDQKSRIVNTKAVVEAVYRYDVDIVGHPGLKLNIDTRELARACAKCGTALEINATHGPKSTDFARAAAVEGVDFAINSDAHKPADVGRLEPGISLAEKLKIPPERIINAWG